MYFELDKLPVYSVDDDMDARSATPIYDQSDIRSAATSMCIFHFGPGQSRSEHIHEREAEIYIPLAGRGKLIIEDIPYEMRPGVVCYVPPKHRHITLNDGDERLDLLCIFSPHFSLDYVRQWNRGEK